MDGRHGKVDMLLHMLRKAVRVAGNSISVRFRVLIVPVLGVKETFGLLYGAIELDPVVS